jgi:hypothetical protein
VKERGKDIGCSNKSDSGAVAVGYLALSNINTQTPLKSHVGIFQACPKVAVVQTGRGVLEEKTLRPVRGTHGDFFAPQTADGGPIHHLCDKHRGLVSATTYLHEKLFFKLFQCQFAEGACKGINLPAESPQCDSNCLFISASSFA